MLPANPLISLLIISAVILGAVLVLALWGAHGSKSPGKYKYALGQFLRFVHAYIFQIIFLGIIIFAINFILNLF